MPGAQKSLAYRTLKQHSVEMQIVVVERYLASSAECWDARGMLGPFTADACG